MRQIYLYTVQEPGCDLTATQEPPAEYTDPGGVYYDIAQYLGWKFWAWCLYDLQDFENIVFDLKYLKKAKLWYLYVPIEKIRWCGLTILYDCSPIEGRFYARADSIYETGDVPQGLVKIPIDKKWVVRVVPAQVELRWLL